MLKKILILTIMATGLVGCSDEESQDTKDLQDHQRNKSVFSGNSPKPLVVEEERPEVEQRYLQSLFYINPKSSLIFVQGESKKVYFDVSLIFADMDGLRYNIKMTDGPSSLGARFGKDAKGYYFQWSPNLDILNNKENSSDYPLELHFELAANTAQSNREELKNQDTKRIFWVTLMKNRSQPVIKNVEYVTADQVLNEGNIGKINFTVEVNGPHKAKDISVGYIYPDQNDDTPALELVQMSASSALIGLPKRTSTSSAGAGITRYHYQVQFDASKMIEHAITKIEANSTLKARMNTNRINTVEGVFEVEAYNDDNGSRSQQKKIMYKVNLTPEAGEAALLGYEALSMKQGSGDRLSFQIVSAGGKGNVEVTSEIPEVNGVRLSFNCNHSSELANREIQCYSSNCMLQCRIQAESTCDAKPGIVTLPIKATTQLYEDEKISDFEIKVRINANPAYCTGGPS